MSKSAMTMFAASASSSDCASGSEKLIQKLCFVCNFLFLSEFREISMFHVKGHSGHPCNDLADSVCSHFFKHRPAANGHPKQ